jgi:hypothetical protein
MLFIYGSLAIGGIETFFVRMAKERNKNNLKTNVLLLGSKENSDPELLSEMESYAKVYFSKDVFYGPYFLTRYMPLLAPIKVEKIKDIFTRVDQIHVSDGELALLGYRFTQLLNINTPISVGFYNPVKFLWGGFKVKYYERINRAFVLNYLPKPLLLLFSNGNLETYNKISNINLTGANTFRLGVVDRQDINVNGKIGKKIKICSVGRLVEYKTYNIYMLDVINNLVNKGVDVEYHIYGDGDFKSDIFNKIKKLQLEDHIKIIENLPYSKFNEIVGKYDIFVGSGTAIIQASSLGVCSIVGIEQIDKPVTYGFFSDVHEYEYNIKGLGLPLFEVEKLISDYINSSENERANLKKSHFNSIDSFTNSNCANLMEYSKSVVMPPESFKYNTLCYHITRLFDKLHIKISKNHPRNHRK